MDEKQLQEKYLEFQAIDQKLQQAQQNLQQYDEHIAEMQKIKENLDDLKKVKAGTEIMVPVSSGIFVKAEMKNSDELMVNVGGGNVVGRTVEGTKTLLDAQLKEIKKSRGVAEENFQHIMNQAKLLEEEIAKIIEKK